MSNTSPPQPQKFESESSYENPDSNPPSQQIESQDDLIENQLDAAQQLDILLESIKSQMETLGTEAQEILSGIKELETQALKEDISLLAEENQTLMQPDFSTNPLFSQLNSMQSQTKTKPNSDNS